MLVYEVLRGVIKKVQTAEFFSIVADETSVITTKEQLSLCVRYTDEKYI